MDDISTNDFNLQAIYQKQAKRFLGLPFEDLPQVGSLLIGFSEYCVQALKEEKSPDDIVRQFFNEVADVHEEKEQVELLFWFLQFIERQVVLFDAIEDAIFEKTHDRSAPGSLEEWLKREDDLSKTSLEDYRIRLVLTAHPTQFYPSQIIGILQDLTVAIGNKDEESVGELLLQMAKTSFSNAHKPTPLDEAVFLAQYLDQIFYPTISSFQQTLNTKLGDLPTAVELGFWPGGDRDGNPYVTAQITETVVNMLHQRVLNKYLTELEQLKHRLTFKHILERLDNIAARLQATLQKALQQPNIVTLPYSTPLEFKNDLIALKNIIDEQHGGLYSDKVEHLISAVTCFGFHYASLDIRQDSLVHSQLIHEIFQKLNISNNYINKTEDERLLILQECFNKQAPISLPSFLEGSIQNETITLFRSIKNLQNIVGEDGLNRYIISHTQSAHHVLEVMLLLYWCGFEKNAIPMNIVPLFESIEDLKKAPTIMKCLYQDQNYSEHLKSRKKVQTIMLGYSDGTKDGGYLTANWAIYQAKARLKKLSDEYSVGCVFFDGRGGPPSRGGGNTHKFYRALASTIPQRELQLTLQGQTISTNFGTIAAARYNIAQLYTAGLANFNRSIQPMLLEDQALLESLSKLSSDSYQTLIHHPKFIPYLENITPLNYFGELNIASRPPRRDKQGPLNLDNLRAITFVSSWSEMKQNVPGYFGFGTAVQKLIEQGKQTKLQTLYKQNLYFHTLVENTMQSLLKNYFPLTHYLAGDREYGDFWKLLSDEAALTESVLLKITGQPFLLAENSAVRSSIQLRESIVLPLQVIQQAILIKLRQPGLTEEKYDLYKKIILKSLPTNLNASRNSA